MTNIETVDVIDEVHQNFIDSSYDVNCNRAFPDIRDGLKPSQRACLWTMYKNKFTSNKPHVKSAKISGMVAASLWPHGTQAIYETFARMSMPYINNVPEVSFHGSNGNQILGSDNCAADRYTESRLSEAAEHGMFKGIEKNSVDMILNFSEDEYWPKVLPAVFPRLLVNGCAGIGVSIANYWTPHNFDETSNLILDYLKNNKLDYSEYYPDFPTGGTIINKDELLKINETGKGRIILEASYKINGKTINFYEMPYQVYIEPVIEEIKAAVESEKITHIKEVYNKSDKKQLSLEVTCDSVDNVNKVLNMLFEYTSLRSQYNVNQVGMVSKTPTLRTLQETVDIYVEHNLTCIKREFEYDKEKTEERINVLKGLIIAINNIDEVINIIKNSSDSKNELAAKFNLNEEQIVSILNMKLSKLSKLETDKVVSELNEKEEYLKYCIDIIGSNEKQKDIPYDRLKELKDKYSTPRKTKIIQKEVVKNTKKGNGKKAAEPETVVAVVNIDGYIKSIPVKSYKKTTDELMAVKTIDQDDMVRVYTNLGKLYRIQLKAIKKCAWNDKGTALGSILELSQGEKIIAADCILASPVCDYIAIATSNGMIKKVKLSDYNATTRSYSGVKYINLKDDAEVIGIQYGKEGDVFTLETNENVINFSSDELSYAGKTAAGVKGITLVGDDKVVNFKINKSKNIKIQKRGGKGCKRK